MDSRATWPMTRSPDTGVVRVTVGVVLAPPALFVPDALRPPTPVYASATAALANTAPERVMVIVPPEVSWVVTGAEITAPAIPAAAVATRASCRSTVYVFDC